jgi:hypothetical protein
MSTGPVLVFVLFAALAAAIALILWNGQQRERRNERQRIEMAGRRHWGYEAEPGGSAFFRLRGTAADGLRWTLESGMAARRGISRPATVWWSGPLGPAEIVLQIFGRQQFHALQRSAARGRRGFFSAARREEFIDVLSFPEVPLSNAELGRRFAVVARSRRAREIIPPLEPALAELPLGTGEFLNTALSMLVSPSGAIRIEVTEHLREAGAIEALIEFAVEAARLHQLIVAPVGTEQ